MSGFRWCGRGGRGGTTLAAAGGGSVPAYIQAMAANSGKQLTSANISTAFGTFTNQGGDNKAILGYSGAAYDTARKRIMHMGGGHADWNGNAVYGLAIYDSETPAWSRFKDNSPPPSATPQTNGPECHDTLNGVSAPGAGDPASHHSYQNLVYDATNDRLVLCGLPSVYSSNGNGYARIRTLNLATNNWDALTARPSKANQGQGSAALWDNGVIWCKEMQISLGIQRYDVAANTISTVSDGLATFNIDVAMAIKPGAYIVAIGGSVNGSPLDAGGADMVLWDLTSYGAGSITTYSRTVGVPAALKTVKVGLEYHPPSGNFVAWIGGNTIHVLTPPANPFTGTWTFSTRTPTGDALPAISTSSLGGVYSKFRWAPYPGGGGGVFIMTALSGTDGNYTVLDTYLYKPDF